MIPKADSSHFTWDKWRGGSLRDVFRIPHRRHEIVRHAPLIARHCIGFARAENLLCRPRKSGYAIMLDVNGLVWCHVTDEEWEAINRASR